MSYTKAIDVLPHNILCAVQQYIDGAYIYIPRKEDQKQAWGANTQTKASIQTRNREIVSRRLAGCPVSELAEQYFLSQKAIYKILNASKNG